MKVRELRERLKEMPQDEDVGTSDDFGEIEHICDVSEPDIWRHATDPSFLQR